MALPAQTSALRLLLVGAALLGFLVVTHLALQASADFVNGCSGVSGPVAFDPAAPTEASGCAEVTQSAYAKTFGVSQITWGFLFYGLLVLLRLAYAVTANDRLRLAAFALNAVGLLFAAWLIYVMAFRLEAFCALCLTSHALTLTLFVLHLLEHRRLRGATGAEASRRGAPADRRGLAALRPYAPLLGLFAVLVGADVALAGRSTADASAEPARQLTTDATPPTLPGTTPPATPPAQGCQFDPGIEPIADLTPFTDGPFKGSADEGAVPVIEIFDPNCPHCRDLGEVLAPIAEAEAGRARFYYVAYPLRQESVAQVIALNEAQREGKYFELMDEMFRRLDQTWGMSLPELSATLDAVGMDGAAFLATLQDQARLAPLLERINADREAVGAAFASADGGISTPRVAVGNRVVLSTPEAFTADCFAEFITEAAAE